MEDNQIIDEMLEEFKQRQDPFNLKDLSTFAETFKPVQYTEFTTHIDLLDNMLTINNTKAGFRTSRLYTLLGCTGSGKSLFMFELALRLSIYNKPEYRGNYKPCILYISLENTEDQTKDRLDSMGLLPSVDFPVWVSHPTYDRILGGFYVESIVQEIEELKQNAGLYPVAIILDYLGELESEGTNSYEAMGKVAKDLKNIAKQYNTCIITAAQCNRDALKLYKQAQGDQEKLEALSNINESNVAESAKIIHVSDYVMFINRLADFQNKGAFLYAKVLKNRDFCSKIEEVLFKYNSQYTRLEPKLGNIDISKINWSEINKKNKMIEKSKGTKL